MDKNSQIYIAGHTGLIGSAVKRCFHKAGYKNLITAKRVELDLADSVKVENFVRIQRPDYIVFAAGLVGGIVENKKFPVDFLNTNLLLQLNMLRSAHNYNVKKLILFASSCMYPRECEQPMSETKLFSGKPESTSIAYAVSKLAGMQMCLAYNQQYGEQRFIPVIPNSAFGPNDNFILGSAHVLSSLIKRFHEAKVNGENNITLWGSGTPRREFIHADDIAYACLTLLSEDTSSINLPINIGFGKDISILELANKIAEIIEFKGTISWDTNKPDGAPRKLLDSTRIQEFGWKPKIKLEDGLRHTYEWYIKNEDILEYK